MNRTNSLKYVFKRVDNSTSMVVNRAEDVCDGKIYLISTLEEKTIKSVDEIWNLEGLPINTYKVYLYSFQFLGYLSSAYYINPSKKYLEKGVEILASWVKYINSGIENQYIYYDFAVANRIIVITEFINICKANEYRIHKKLFKSLLQVLDKDIQFLYDDKNYRDDNHGLMMDRALLQYGTIFNKFPKSSLYIEKAAKRIISQFEFSFGEELINIENSPEYHNLNYKLFKDINDFIKINNISIGVEQFNLDKVYENHCILLKSDYTYPLVGDTSKIKFKNDTPLIKSRVFEKSGIAIIKNNDDYLLCKSGFISKAHKHFDDNSFVFSYYNQDIFIDCGKYSYNSKDVLRQFIISPFAHNTLCVNDGVYILDDKKCGIEKYNISKEFSSVNLFNNCYEGVEINRSIVLIAPNLLIIHDSVKSKQINNYYKMFNICGNFNPKKIDRESLEFECNGILVNIKEINKFDDVRYYCGYNDKLIRGFASEKFNVLKSINSVEYMYKGENLESTVIAKINNGNETEITEYQVISDDKYKMAIKVVYNNTTTKYYLVDYVDAKVEELFLPKINIEFIDMDIKVTIDGEESQQYAAYFKLDSRLVHSEPYSSKNIINYKFESKGKVEVWIFILLANGVKISEKFNL